MFLSVLSQQPDPFITQASHSTLTACTLPTWTPEDIVKEMNTFFGSMLRSELVKLMGESSRLRNQAHSTNSQRLSLDSNEGEYRLYKKEDFEEVLDGANWAKRV